MATIPPLPPQPPEVNSLEEARQVIGELWVLVQELAARVEQTSRNSSKPPSSDGAQTAPALARPRSGRQRGAQQGHRGHRRALVERVDQVIEHQPNEGCACGGRWQVAARPYRRHQIFELPEPRVQVTEHRLYGAYCAECGAYRRAVLPETVGSGQMGPRLLTWISLWAGRYHLSMRQIRDLLQEQYGLRFSVGALSEAQGRVSPMLTRLHQGLKTALRRAERLHVDETGHQRAGEDRWLWLGASEEVVCVQVHYSRARRAAQRLLGTAPAGVVISDGYAVYHWLPEARHQLCWAHVIRQVRAIAERPSETGRLGRRLLRLAQTVFRVRHRFEQGTLAVSAYQQRMQGLRRHFRTALEQGRRLRWVRYAGRCAYLLRWEARLWTFLQDPAIPLTNNEAERRLRGYVLWRKGSFGVWSHRGELFRQRLLSLVETCRVRGVSAYEVLHRLVSAVLTRQPYPDVFGIGLLKPSG